MGGRRWEGGVASWKGGGRCLSFFAVELEAPDKLKEVMGYMRKKEQTPGRFTSLMGAESLARALRSISLPPCGCNCSFRQRSRRCRGRERRHNLHVPKEGEGMNSFLNGNRRKNRLCASVAEGRLF